MQDVKVTQEGVLKIDLAEGVIEDITIEGNDKTKDYVILRELRYKKVSLSTNLLPAGVWSVCTTWDF